MESPRRIVLDPIVDNNPIALQMLGICSALAVTTSLAASLLMCVALTFVLVLSNASVSAIRNRIPSNIRIIVQMTVIASLVLQGWTIPIAGRVFGVEAAPKEKANRNRR